MSAPRRCDSARDRIAVCRAPSPLADNPTPGFGAALAVLSEATLGQDCEHILRVASRKAVHEKLTIAISAKARVLITASTSMAGNRAAAQPAIAVAGAAQGAQGCRVAVPIRIVRRPKSPHWIMRGTLRGIRLEESTGTDD